MIKRRHRFSRRIPAAAVRHVRLPLDAKPHKVVFEQAGAQSSAVAASGAWGSCAMTPLSTRACRKLAAQADAVVVAVGFDADSETEGADREFQLPPGQDRLIQGSRRGQSATPIVVVTAGGSVDVAPWVDKVRGLVAAWYPGQEGGNAFASRCC